MKYKNFKPVIILFVAFLLFNCNQPTIESTNIRTPVDTVGFAQYDWQMDQIIDRINARYGEEIQNQLHSTGISSDDTWKAAISPHDDYAYAGHLYPLALRNIKAKTVILVGVAHKASIMNLENQIIFDSYYAWKGPYGNIKVSKLREDIIQQIPISYIQVNDSMQRIEHSLEALLPFLQHQHRDLEIVPILVPYMAFEQMNSIAIPLAESIYKAAMKNNLKWGKDYAIVISNDAVHYGDSAWGGKNFARYGADSAGYHLAMHHEQKIIQNLSNELAPEKIRRFCEYTVQEDNYKEYKWTWCGRYSVPFGLLTAYHLNQLYDFPAIQGVALGYSSSIDHKGIKVDDLQMGVTAPAHIRHWVGYAAMGYR